MHTLATCPTIGIARTILSGGEMKPKKRQKLCYNCEGEVDLDVIFCPYCGSDLLEEKAQRAAQENALMPEKNTLRSPMDGLYPPPYPPKKSFEEQELEQQPLDEPESAPNTPAVRKGSFLPTLLLTLGVQALLIGVLLFILSENGAVRLKFDAKTWLFYVLFSMPLLYFGWKKSSQLD